MSLKNKRILVIRFSSMGDVLLTRPVLENFVKTYSNNQVSFLSQQSFEPYFQGTRSINFIGADLKGPHKGIRGLWRLARSLKGGNFDQIIDLHNVFRSRLLSLFLSIPVSRINKGRGEKRKLTRKYNKILKPLDHTSQRYAKAFENAGFPLSIDPSRLVSAHLKTPGVPFRIGLAPLSRHIEKEWPLAYMRMLIQSIKNRFSCEISILGGPSEKPLLDDYYADIALIKAGALKPAEELEFIKTLDLIITMDSANLHLASLLGIPSVSIWGPTHPFAGFSPMGNFHLMVQKNDLYCRPCSVFGNKPCYRKDHACMNELTPDFVFHEIENFILKLQKSQ